MYLAHNKHSINARLSIIFVKPSRSPINYVESPHLEVKELSFRSISQLLRVTQHGLPFFVNQESCPVPVPQ